MINLNDSIISVIKNSYDLLEKNDVPKIPIPSGTDLHVFDVVCVDNIILIKVEYNGDYYYIDVANCILVKNSNIVSPHEHIIKKGKKYRKYNGQVVQVADIIPSEDGNELYVIYYIWVSPLNVYSYVVKHEDFVRPLSKDEKFKYNKYYKFELI